MGSRPRRGPRPAGRAQAHRIGQPFDREMLQRRQPMKIVGLARIGVAGRLGLPDFVAGGPSVQVKMPRSCRLRVMAKAWASHGSRKTGPSCPAAAPAATASISGSWLPPLKMGLPAIDGDGMTWIGRLAPELGPAEDDGIDPLRILAPCHWHWCRERRSSLNPLYNAGLAADIARQARMTQGIDVLRAHAVTHPEHRGALQRPVAGPPWRGLRAHLRTSARGAWSAVQVPGGLPAATSSGVTRPRVASSFLSPFDPDFIVAGSEVVGCRVSRA